MRFPTFVSHSFEHASLRERLLDLARAGGVDIADLSVPVWRRLPGTRAQVLAGIHRRIARSSRVLVLVTDAIHRLAAARYYRAATDSLQLSHGRARSQR